MNRFKNWLAICVCTAFIGFGVVTVANAQNSRDTSKFTVTEPLDVGGTVLQPGEYQIRDVPKTGGRNILQVWNADATQLFTTLLSVPHAPEPEGLPDRGSNFVYYPASAQSIKALRTWYPFGAPAGGHDIVYPKGRAMELAAIVAEPVVAIPDKVEVAELETIPLVVVTPEKEIQPYEVATIQEPPAKLAQNTPSHELLPQTASHLPLITGLGFLSLFGALGLGVLARRFV
jgi:hypothetical protein